MYARHYSKFSTKMTTISHYTNPAWQKHLLILICQWLIVKTSFVLTVFISHLISTVNKIRHGIMSKAVSKEVI